MRPRLRIYVLDPVLRERDRDQARLVYDHNLNKLGAKYGGWISHSYREGPRPCHFYLIDDPSDHVIELLVQMAETLPFKIVKELCGGKKIEY